MSELQAKHIVDAYDAYTAEPWKEQSQVYLKVEADAVIAELEQKLQDQCVSCPVKMQEDDVVAELNKEIERLKKSSSCTFSDDCLRVRQLKREIKFTHSNCKWGAGDACARLSGERLAIIEANIKLEKELRHQKYRRCLNAASYWIAVSYQCVDTNHRQRAERHHRKWLELAIKFEKWR